MTDSARTRELTSSTKRLLWGLRGIGGSFVVTRPSTFTVFGANPHDGVIAHGSLVEAFDFDLGVMDFGELAKQLTPSRRAILDKGEIVVSGQGASSRFGLARPHELKLLNENMRRLATLTDRKLIASFSVSADDLAQHKKTIQFGYRTHVRFFRGEASSVHVQIADLRVRRDRINSDIEGAVGESFDASLKACTYSLMLPSTYEVAIYEGGFLEFSAIDACVSYLLKDQRLGRLFDHGSNAQIGSRGHASVELR